ncbi:nucleotidyltransferase [Chenggangzhangella methanolivorans]|uniref:nucleotidyltransferase n=1 Tax=Chenggangzhangella methanolivorans TaxID=1437009 RepID=UPI0021BD1098|nr:nucleotidyltransferase [Chenggangzhangella methanolivorans]
MPADWDDDHALDLLEESLQGFPGAAAIVRRTRCVQIQFPFMHMDVAILDRRARLAIPRAGEIFHSPDTGASMRVSSNPWGFTGWFRLTVGVGDAPFTEALRRHRQDVGRDRLPVLDASEAVVVAKAEQDDLPPMIPSRLDAQQAVALKLLKRNLNISYAGAATPRPPSIYVTKRAADIGYIPQGLTAQLYVLASDTAKIMRDHLDAGTQPEDLNPSYPPDRITDRWPRAGKPGETDMRTLAEALEHLGERLAEMATAPLAEIAAIVDELFGERIGKQQRAVLAKRYDRRDTGAPILSAPRTGGIYAPAIAPASAPLVEVPRHNFHAGRAVKIR